MHNESLNNIDELPTKDLLNESIFISETQGVQLAGNMQTSSEATPIASSSLGSAFMQAELMMHGLQSEKRGPLGRFSIPKRFCVSLSSGVPSMREEHGWTGKYENGEVPPQ